MYYVFSSDQNPYAEIGIVATGIEPILKVYKTFVLTVELCYNGRFMITER